MRHGAFVRPQLTSQPTRRTSFARLLVLCEAPLEAIASVHVSLSWWARSSLRPARSRSISTVRVLPATSEKCAEPMLTALAWRQLFERISTVSSSVPSHPVPPLHRSFAAARPSLTASVRASKVARDGAGSAAAGLAGGVEDALPYGSRCSGGVSILTGVTGERGAAGSSGAPGSTVPITLCTGPLLW